MIPTHGSRRRTLLLVAIVAVLVAATVPWLLRNRHRAALGWPPAAAPLGTQVRVATRIGPAQELVAAHVAARVLSDASDRRAAAGADTALGLDLLQRVQGDSTGNVSVSPMSLALALTMLQNGAAGRTRAGIGAALHSGGLGDTALDAGWSALVREWTSAALRKDFSLRSANSLWMAPDLPVRSAFLDALAQYFGTGVWRVDFTSPAAKRAIDTWTSQHTDGRIPKLFDTLDPSTQAVLANAVYFKAAWQQPFSPTDTQPGRFTDAAGTSKSTPFMAQTANLESASSSGHSGYQAVQLPYRGGRFAALAIMPTAGSLTDYVRTLAPAALQQVVDGLSAGSVELRMPKFTTASKLELNRPLMAMGMGDAFAGSADFSRLSPVRLQVSQVVQRVFLKVGEKGTEAAAATGVAMAVSGAVAKGAAITLDHPFLFLIRDTETGAILFASEIRQPSAG